MATCILAFPDYIQADPRFATVAFSGGSWNVALPISNLLNPKFAYVARSTNLALSSTQFWADLGAPRNILVIAIPRFNGSRLCQVRMRGFVVKDSTTTAIADTGWQNYFESVYPVESLFWGHPSLWDGKLDDEDAAIFPIPFVVVFDQPMLAQYWLIEFSDTANAAGYIEVPRIIFAPGYQPTLNMDYGANIIDDDPSVVQTSLGGQDFFDPRPQRRTVHATFTNLPEDEAKANILDMQRRLGVRGQLYFVWDPDDTVNMHRQSFLARMKTLSPLTAGVYASMTPAFELQEIVA